MFSLELRGGREEKYGKYGAVVAVVLWERVCGTVKLFHNPFTLQSLSQLVEKTKSAVHSRGNGQA
jgi:hypothetical protein